ncbi:MAG: hypothetical protein C5B49_00515 [Bdellovibrio sp.]|nr:MAG: hypothetical protein C5B49_00515 [Bdellovibrio sp.]
MLNRYISLPLILSFIWQSVPCLADCSVDGMFDTRQLPTSLPTMDARINGPGRFNKYRAPACRGKAQETTQNLNWNELFRDRLANKVARSNTQLELAEAIEFCSPDHPKNYSSDGCAEVNDFVEKTIPDRYSEARMNLLVTLIDDWTHLKEDAKIPVRKLRSPEYGNIENYDIATKREREDALIAIEKSIQDIRQGMKERGQDPDKDLAKFKRNVEASREVQYRQQYFGLIDAYPILLRIRSPQTDGKQVRRLAMETLLNLKTYESHLQSLAKKMDHTPIDQLQEELLGPALEMNPFLHKHPEYCDLAEYYLRNRERMQTWASRGKLMFGLGALAIGWVVSGGGETLFSPVMSPMFGMMVASDVNDYLAAQSKNSLVRNIRPDSDEPSICLEEVSQAKDELVISSFMSAANFVVGPAARGIGKTGSAVKQYIGRVTGLTGAGER